MSCSRCNTEYRTGILHCPGCGLALEVSRPSPPDKAESLVEIPGLWEDDIVLLQLLLDDGGFYFHINLGGGEAPDSILVRESDLPRLKDYLSHYRTRTLSGERIPIPW